MGILVGAGMLLKLQQGAQWTQFLSPWVSSDKPNKFLGPCWLERFFTGTTAWLRGNRVDWGSSCLFIFSSIGTAARLCLARCVHRLDQIIERQH